MKNLLIPTLALFLLVFASCQKEELETVAEQAQNNPTVANENITSRSAEVPFKASFKTTVQSIGFDEGIITIDINGTGKATHLGKTTMHSISTINTNYSPFLQSGPYEMTAANGHKVFGDYTGIAIPNQDGTVSFNGTWNITSGTGNYQGVTGSGTYEGTAEPVNPDGSPSVGEISFDGTLEGL